MAETGITLEEQQNTEETANQVPEEKPEQN